MIHPTKWSQLKLGQRCSVELPHKDALVNAEMRNVIVQKTGSVIQAGKKSVLVSLDNSGPLELKSLEALLIDEEDDGKAKPWWKHD